MKLKKLRLSKIKYVTMIILIFFSEFFIMPFYSRASNGDIIITEVMYNPVDKNDWFEIFNSGDENIDLKNLYLIDEFDLKINNGGDKYLNCHSINNDEYIFENSKYLLIGKSKGDFKVNYLDLNGVNKDAIRLSFDNCKTFFTELVYDPKGNRIRKNYSLELDRDGFLRESVNEGGSPGKKNPIFEIIENDGDDDSDEDIIEKGDLLVSNIGLIRINELFPNPKDENDEFIELYNLSDNDIDLEGWILKDSSKGKGYIFKKGDNLRANSYLIVDKKDSKIALNNSNENVYLFDSAGIEIDKISYKITKEGLSYGFDENSSKWRWSEFLTPGFKNEFKEMGKIEIDIDDDIYKDIYANFEVNISGTKSDKLKVKWEFGDEKKSYMAKTRHKYTKNGKYVVKLTVSGGVENVEKEFNIKVEDFPEIKISISAIVANPGGKDSEGEWIELKNKSKNKINLKNWSVATGASKKKLVNHPIFKDFKLKKGKTEILTREFSNFSLNNKGGYIELRYPDGEVAYKLKYKKEDGIKDNEVYRKKEDGGWEWIKDKNVILKKDDDESANLEIMEGIIIEEMEILPEMKPEDEGKYSSIQRDNLMVAYLLSGLENMEIEPENVSKNDKQVLGIWTSNIEKVREEDGIYYFTLKTKKQRHYILKFMKDFLEV